MKLATYNVEWFDHLFDDAGALRFDDGWSGRRDVVRADQIAALGAVFQAMDADGVMVIEAPNDSRKRDGALALETFAAHFNLRARKAMLGFSNQTQQEISFLYDPDVLTVSHDPKESIDAPIFDSELLLDLNVDAKPDKIVWSKPPLELSLRTALGFDLRLIGVHAKSKAPHGARNDQDVIRLSIANRRKQLAQCIWLRRRVEQHLEAAEPLIVLGDFNDGPGLDEYEKLFGRSGVEIVLGEDEGLQLFDPHARMVLGKRLAAAPTSARFKVPPDGRFLSALLDYIMMSPDLRQKRPKWRIWHPFEDPDCFIMRDLQTALLTASDHFPVMLELDI